MYEEYDKSLHAGLKYTTMESAPQKLDEEKLDAAIADLISEQRVDERKVRQLDLPRLRSQEDCAATDGQADAGLTATLRQKWAELSGAA